MSAWGWGDTLKRINTRLVGATAALLCAAPGLVLAQQTQVPEPVPPPAATTTPPAATPPEVTPPAAAAPAGTPPAAPSASPAPAAQTQPAPSTQPKLPEVQVIQEPAKPEAKPVEEAAPKPKPKKKPVVEAAPEPEAAPAPKKKIAAKPKPAAKPAPKPAAQPTAEPAEAEAGPAVETQEATGAQAPGIEPATVKMSPLAGSEIAREKVPAAVTILTSADIKRDGAVIPQDALNTRVPGVVIGDLQGNAFQTNVQYRGFEASPVNGLPQGLAVYQNGVRINEAFGDTVNWDFIPTNAIDGLTVMSGNPIFGLNAIGGALSVTMKDGFSYQGAEVDTRFGSFGRKQVGVQAGATSGGIAIYGAFEGINDDGFRDFSDAEVRRGYVDLGVKSDTAEFHFNFTGADNYVGVTAAVPPELLAFGRERTFTSPQTTENNLEMYGFNGAIKATSTFTITGATYYRHFNQKHDDGNIAEFIECEADGADGPTPGNLCTEDNEEIFAAGSNAPIAFPADIAGSIDRTSQDARSYGVILQGSEKSEIGGHANQLVFGGSYDHGTVDYTASSQLGSFLPRFVVAPTGPLLTGPSTITPRSLTTTNDYYGLYVLDTFDLTEQLTLTAGGRYNFARIEIENTGDPILDTLNGTNTFSRFNPSGGLTYKFVPELSLYGGYSEANRAPTASEIACSDPENPCIIESALASDPPLKQVVSRTWEAGLRGEHKSWDGFESFEWSAGVFRTTNTDDIIQIADSQQGRGYFANFGETRRQGVEASVSYRNQRFFTYASYAYIDATFESAGILSSPNNPAAFDCPVEEAEEEEGEDAPKCIEVSPGDRLPGVPRHRFKAGFDYWVTPQWKFGADLIAASDQIFYGDEGNDNTPLGGYTKVNLHTSYDVTDHVQVYGLIENLFDQQYGIYGTYINVEAANKAAAADPSLPAEPFAEDNAKTITPAIPFALYGGVKVRF